MNTDENGNEQGNGQVVELVQAQPPARDVLAIIDQRNKLMDKLLAYALQSTRSNQWAQFGDKPFPSAAAAEVMARRCGVSIRIKKCEKTWEEDDKGRYYMYTYEGIASLPSGFDDVEAVGTCSSRDQFLGTETRTGRLMSEIDEGNIKKAAYSNMIVNAVTRLLGLRGLTWEQLAEHGIKKEGAQKANFQAGSQGGSGGRKNPGKKATEKQVKMIFAKCINDLGYGDDKIKQLSLDITGKEKSSEWTMGDIDKLMDEIKGRAANMGEVPI
jgi:hypothetical protein